MVWNYSSIRKLQSYNRCNLGVDKLFNPTFYRACDYISILGLNLNRVSKWGPSSASETHISLWLAISNLNQFTHPLRKSRSKTSPDSNVHGANMGPTWVLSSPGGPRVGPMNIAIWVSRDKKHLTKGTYLLDTAPYVSLGQFRSVSASKMEMVQNLFKYNGILNTLGEYIFLKMTRVFAKELNDCAIEWNKKHLYWHIAVWWRHLARYISWVT